MSDDSMNGKHHEGDVAFIQSLAELLNASELSDLARTTRRQRFTPTG